MAAAGWPDTCFVLAARWRGLDADATWIAGRRRRPVAAGRPAAGRGTAARTLRIIHASDLQSLDPIWTTAPPTKDYAFLTFDQLIAVDANYVPRPQMADGLGVRG